MLFLSKKALAEAVAAAVADQQNLESGLPAGWYTPDARRRRIESLAVDKLGKRHLASIRKALP